MVFMGMDGGGTKTSFLLINEKGNILSELITGTTHVDQIGFEGFENILKTSVETLCQRATLVHSDIDFSFLGIPAYGENKEAITKVENIVTALFPKGNFKCGNDVEAGWAGSLACKPGINLILGTGAIALGVNERFETVRTSGWGHICGDEGSAYWIAKKGIEIFGKESDGRLPRTPLYTIFKEQLSLKTDFDLIYLILDDYKQDRGKIASLATLVYQAATQNDSFAIDIFKQAAHECLLMIQSICNQLSFNGVIPVSYSGSVFNSGELILKPLKDALETTNLTVEFLKPILSPVKGSALYALSLHTPLTSLDSIVANLIEA